MRTGQGTPTNWTAVATVNPDHSFRGTLAALGGWYRLELRAIAAGAILADTLVNRVGVGEVFLIAGQSNAQGGIEKNVPPALDDRVSCVDLFQYNAIDAQAFPFLFSHVSAGASIGPSNSPYLWGILGDSLTRRLNVPILFLGAAQGGSNSTEWAHSAGATPATLPYQRISSVLLSYVNRLGLRAILWHQGESDEGVDQQTYFANLSTLIGKSRQQLAHSRLAWLVARASYISGSTNGQVISAQNQLSQQVSDVYAGPATDGLTGPDNRVDDIHFGGQGLVRVANLWNQSLTDQFFSQSVAFTPNTTNIPTDGGWQPVATGAPFSSLQRVGYRYESATHDFFLLVGSSSGVEGRLERLDSGDFTETGWSALSPISGSGYANVGFSDYTSLRHYGSSVAPGRYRLWVRGVNEPGPGYQLETDLREYRNTLYIGNEPTPPPPVVQQADLSITMQTDRLVVGVGQPITQQVFVRNKGPQTATGVRLQSRLPAGLTFIDSPQASVTALNNIVTAAFDTLRPNTTGTISIRTAVMASGNYAVAAQLTASNQVDPNSQPGTGTADGEDDTAKVNFRTNDGDSTRHESPNPGGRILPAVIADQPDPAKADLSLAMQTSSNVVTAGSSLTLVCAVSNRGGLTATNVDIEVALPTGWQLLNTSSFTISSASVSGQTFSGTLAQVSVGNTSLLTLVVRVGATTSRAQLTSQLVRVDQPDPDSTPGNGYNRGEDDEATIDVRVL